MKCVNGLSSECLSGSLEEYRLMLKDIIAQNPSVTFLTAHELSQTLINEEANYCQIRHDVDADIVSCLPMAEIEASLGIKSTYFLLHTSNYYGDFKLDLTNRVATFNRNENMAELYLALQKLGHEVAVHTDPLYLYQNFNIDGAEALEKEIRWLRSLGLSITGTAPHNNSDEYGASNSAIFINRDITTEKKAGAQGVIFNNKWAALARLDEAKLGLLYEADDINSPTHNMCVDYLSPVAKDKWYRFFKTPEILHWEKTGEDPTGFGEANFWELFSDIYTSEGDLTLRTSDIPHTFSQRSPKISILSVHPEHFGFRSRESAMPILKG